MTQQPRRPRRRSPDTNLSAEQEQDLIRRYTQTDEPVQSIATAFNVHPTYPYRVLEKHNIPRRRPQSKARVGLTAGLEREAGSPGIRTTEQAPPPPPQIPRLPSEPLAIADLGRWLVEISERFEVAADSIEGALFAARQLRPDARITSIRHAG